MFSIIVCSIDANRLNALEKNISATAGDTLFEIIAFDNSKECRSIAWVYNHCAARARYPYLLFIHEDAGFKEAGWMEQIAEKLAESDCGVIGFAGTRLMVNAPGGWNVMPRWCVMNLEERGVRMQVNVCRDSSFVEVVAVDGFAMFVRREVWEKHPFDEEFLTGFHCYDVDFSLGVGSEYRNYVCCNVPVYHNSCGNFGKDWTLATLRIYTEKWKTMLPRYVKGEELASKQGSAIEERVTFRFLKLARRHGIPVSGIESEFLKYPCTVRHLEHLFKYYILRVK